MDDGAGTRRSDKPSGGRGVDADSGDDWVGGATDGSKSGEAEARLRPAMARGMVPAGERAGEGKGKGRGREWMERVGQARALYIVSVGEVAAMQAASAHADGSSCTVSALLQLRIQISNTTSNVPLKLILRASVAPKPRRVSQNSMNKSCRSTYQLQLLLKLQSLIRPRLGDTRFQSGLHEN